MDFRGESWQYTWEALSHVKTLRLFLTNNSASYHPLQCEKISASLLRPEGSFKCMSLVIKWVESDGACEVSLRVPIPPVVVLDHSYPVEVKALPCHIEATLILLLPVDHPCSQTLSSLMGAPEDNQRQLGQLFQPENDTQILASKGEIHLYCRKCSRRLTEEPLRSFKDQPSVHWRDVADNWFGSCCCSFGGISHVLVSKFEKFSSICQGSCFVGVASLLVHNDDIATGVVKEANNIDAGHEESAHCSLVTQPVHNNMQKIESLDNHNASDIDEAVNNVSLKGCLDQFAFVDANDKNNLKSKGTNENNFTRISNPLPRPIDYECGHNTCESKVQFLPCDSSNYSHEKEDKLEFAQRATREQIPYLDMESNLSSNCCTRSSVNTLLEHQQHTTEFCEGFMMGPSDVSYSIEWKPLYCSSCLSLLGSYPHAGGGKILPDKSIRLFKYQISTSEKAGSLDDVFRDKSIQRVFVHQLQAGADEEFSYRTVIRNPRTKVPLLKLVLLNANAWISNGKCYKLVKEDGKMLCSSKIAISRPNLHTCDHTEDATHPHPGSLATDRTEELDAVCCNLTPIVKVLFCDCSNITADKSRSIDRWATDKHAEDIFMLEEEIEKLRETLLANKLKIPVSNTLLEGFSVSFFEK